MSENIATTGTPSTGGDATQPQHPAWHELWRKEDWWAVWLGLGLVVAGYALFSAGSSLAWIAVAPAKWTTFSQLTAQLSAAAPRYAALLGLFLVVFTVAASFIGYKAKSFIPAFILVFLVSVAIYAAGSWAQAQRYNLEPPLVALVLGLLVSNLLPLPEWLNSGLRVEFFIKTGIVLLGAGLPFTLIVWAGPVAILQASIVSIATFLVIYFVGRRLGLERPLAATLGAGGAVCGVSAAIAVGGAVRAKKEDPPIAITLVILWAIVLIFVLPFVSRALLLPAGVGGAWIGTSEFADAAGLAAAQTYGGIASHTAGISGTADQALIPYTLIKVVGRDVWIGIWAFVLAFISITRWEVSTTGRKANAGQIWWRFPKFVLGFIAASLVITLVVRGFTFADYNKLVKPGLVAPLISLRTWAFTFAFLSIGLTTRLRGLASAGRKPFVAFTSGVIVNVVLGYVLSAVVFRDYWANLTH
jgi:uncharacterized membrane protein YadS